VSRRVRAIAFVLAASVAAAGAAAIADGYGESVARRYGDPRTVVVAAADIEPGRPIDPEVATRALELRRVPARFVPPGALRAPAEAVGLVPAARLPAGSYLLGSQLRPPRPPRPGTVLERGRRPVQIAVSGAEALLSAGMQPVGTRVDVVVTSEPSGSARGRTYVAAPGVPLLGLGPGVEGPSGETVEATLALTRPQALRLISAESFARRVTIIPRG
jgi:Flp pilus assembly protein CpaB